MCRVHRIGLVVVFVGVGGACVVAGLAMQARGLVDRGKRVAAGAGERVTGISERRANAEGILRDQLVKLNRYISDAVQPNGLVRDALPLSPGAAPGHPATPDAAGFALLGLCAADRVGLRTDAPMVVERILRAYAGQTPGAKPDRSADGFWTHYMNVKNGAYAGRPWERVYTPIGSALLVAGAEFAKNNFAGNRRIAMLADRLGATTHFNAAIHETLDGGVYLAMAGGGGGDAARGFTRPWNEFMLVVSLARRERDNGQARAVAKLWLDPVTAPKVKYGRWEMLTDRAGAFAPAFWVQQAHFFNADFAGNAGFETLFANQRAADAHYCATELGQEYRYGLTAGVSPSGYTVDAIRAAQGVFSPEAVMAWGDTATFLRFYREQAVDDPRGRYGLTRVSTRQAEWWPGDAGLVDHLMMMFGLTEAIDPWFFKGRQGGQADADGDGIADRFDNCPSAFNPNQLRMNGHRYGDACAGAGDFDHDGDVDGGDVNMLEAYFSQLRVPEATECGDRQTGGTEEPGDFEVFQKQLRGARG